MTKRLVVFDANDLLELVKHYSAHTAEPIPIEGRLLEFGPHAILTRWIGMLVEGEWPDREEFAGGGQTPLHIRYSGKKVMTWGRRGQDSVWQDGDDVRFG